MAKSKTDFGPLRRGQIKGPQPRDRQLKSALLLLQVLRSSRQPKKCDQEFHAAQDKLSRGRAPAETSAFVGQATMPDSQLSQQSGRTDWQWTALNPDIHRLRKLAERTAGCAGPVQVSEWWQCQRQRAYFSARKCSGPPTMKMAVRNVYGSGAPRDNRHLPFRLV